MYGKSHLYRFFIFLVILSSTFGCGSKEDEIKRSLKKARVHLSNFQCDEALDELNEVGIQNKNPDYLKILASAYTCKAGFSEPTFFGTDLPLMGTGDADFFGSITTFTTSNATSSLSLSYSYLQQAIETLLYPGDLNESSYANRVSLFGESEVSNMDSQALYMILAQIGNYLQLYGNTDDSGNKGAGDTLTTNDCITDYTTPSSQAARTAATGGGLISPCTSNADGHPELASTASGRKIRLCQGVVLFNNFIDIFSNLTFTGVNSETLDDLNLTDYCTTAGLGAVCTCLLYTSPSPRDATLSRMPSSA